jgi:hypothetical protein
MNPSSTVRNKSIDQEAGMSNDKGLTRTEPGEVASARDAETGPPATVEEAVASATTTSLACYFSKGGSTTWYWGLNDDNSYYKLNGEWKTTPYTRLKKFFTSTTSSEIRARADKAKSYNNLAGYELVAIFAADSSSGYNYPIVVNNTEELYPNF